MAESQTTLRDQLSEAFTQVEETPAATTPAQAPVTPAAATPIPVTTPAETEEQKAARARDEKGRFVETKPDDKTTPSPTPAQAPRPKKPVPSTWKKDYHSHWEALAPELQDYMIQREGEFAKGVSTYKQEWDRAKPILDALTPYMPLLQQHGITPDRWISGLGNAHRLLATGSPQEKIAVLYQLANDYGVQIGQQQQGQQGQGAPALAQQDPNFAWLTNQVRQLQEGWQSWQAQQKTAQEQAVNSEIHAFASDAKHLHFEQVKDTMAGLLQAGLADDLQSAYDAALRHPRHSDLYAEIEQREHEADEAKRRADADAAAKQAKAKAVSPRSITPVAQTGTPSGKKDLRSQLSETFDAAIGGRI